MPYQGVEGSKQDGRENAEEDIEPFCQALCRFLAASTAGIYQADGAGFFTADGTVIVKE